MWGKILAGAAITSTLLLTACGGGGSSSSAPAQPTSKAHFVDNAVIGLRYRCAGSADFKLTGGQGGLRCPPGQTVSFYVGDILLGKVTMAAGTSFITPMTLATSEGGVDENVVINIARLLISLDADQDTDNGIQIDANSHVNTDLVLDFSLSPANFEAAAGPVLTALTQGVDSGPFALVDETPAGEHLVFGLYLANAGFYEGTIQRGPDSSSELAFLASRLGAVYGVNRAESGQYAAAAFDEMQGEYDPFETNDGFKIDGDTGATLLLDVNFANGKAEGSSGSEYPTFTATRKITFDPLMNIALLEAFNTLTPVAIDLKGDGEYFVLDNDPLSGMFFGTFQGGTPNAEDPTLQTEYWDINYADVVSAKNGVLRLIALSTNGYLVELNANFKGEEPVINTRWRQLHEGQSGTTSTYEANFDYSNEGPLLLQATKKAAKHEIQGYEIEQQSSRF